ncbi:MAG: chorismate--pyruvate lyase [Lachnospiraceae bacterium]|nr:chorismate--pyruvate lyase [Lachnospiraceae bacterium]
MFERVDYIIERIDGDYAYLKKVENPDEELKCVARALLPEEIMEGSRVAYELLQYRIVQ